MFRLVESTGDGQLLNYSTIYYTVLESLDGTLINRERPEQSTLSFTHEELRTGLIAYRPSTIDGTQSTSVELSIVACMRSWEAGIYRSGADSV